MGTHTNRVVTLAMGTGESLVANSNTIKKITYTYTTKEYIFTIPRLSIFL